MSEPIISVSGLRGVVGETLTPEVATRYVAAFAAALPPGPVVQTETPKDTRIGVRVASIQRVPVVNQQHRVQRLLVGGRPLDDLFSPVHPVVAVNLAAQQHLPLARVPERVVRARALKMLRRV